MFNCLVKNMLDRAVKLYPNVEITDRKSSGERFSYTYKDMHERICRLANVLDSLGIKGGDGNMGDRVGVVAWNNHRHLELFLGVPMFGAVFHSLNVRLSLDHLSYIVNHAEDQVIFCDQDFLPLFEAMKDRIATVKHFIIMTDEDRPPETKLSPVSSYEDLLSQASPEYTFPDFDENTPMAMCYTTATTGRPKGCVYTHRMQYIHALAAVAITGANDKSVQMSMVPMFHMLGWGAPYAGTWFGMKQALTGRHPDAATFAKLIEEEKATDIMGVPVLARAVLEELRTGKYDYSSLKRTLVGGSAPDLALIKGYEDLGIEFYQGYGMTETAPVIAMSIIKGPMEDWPTEKKQELKRKQGLVPPCLEWKIVNEKGEEVKWDGKEIGQLVVRGAWVIEEYYKEPEKTAECFKDGWLYTRDMATVDEEGYIYIVDRAGDLIKSGGEWISTLDLDDYIMRHPAVLEAATIGVPNPRWDERPVAFVVPRPEARGKITDDELRSFLLDEVKVAKWWIPDRFIFVDEIPKTAAAKFDKKTLKEKYAEEG